MKYGFLPGALRLFAIGVIAMVPVLSLPGTAQNSGSQNRAKASAGSTFEGEIMDGDCAQMGSHDAAMKAETLATPDLCTTYCLRFKKTPGKYVLYDGAAKMIYQLDNQQEASFFAARKVKITGTYDEATKTIHVKEITSTSAPKSRRALLGPIRFEDEISCNRKTLL